MKPFVQSQEFRKYIEEGITFVRMLAISQAGAGRRDVGTYAAQHKQHPPTRLGLGPSRSTLLQCCCPFPLTNALPQNL